MLGLLQMPDLTRIDMTGKKRMQEKPWGNPHHKNQQEEACQPFFNMIVFF